MNPPPSSEIASPSAAAFWRVMPLDADAIETREWLDAFEAVVRGQGSERGPYLLRRLLDAARAARVPLPAVLNTPYVNSIALDRQPQFPGNLELEARIGAIVRWN